MGTLMVPTLTVHTLTVPTLMVHLVAPNVLLKKIIKLLTLTVPTLMVPTLMVPTLTVPTLMVHLVAPNVLLNRFKEKIKVKKRRLIASQNVTYLLLWNHETAIGWRSKKVL